MRDKLSNMIQSAVGGCAKYWADVIADKLLVEGVIVPPCKVGRTVFHIRRTPKKHGGSYIVEARVNGVLVEQYEEHLYIQYYVEYVNHRGDTEEETSILGKWCFLTREEAERALERSENGT